jgi:pyridoxamine 5'-phosphate oxidase
MSIADLRKDYKLASLTEADVDSDPFKQFGKWLSEAIAAEIPEPTAMSLATASGTTHEPARPSSRIVLLKGFNVNGFVFFTNYNSRKGAELAGNPFASLLFHWVELERQVRIEGRVEKVSAQESDAYFLSRPLGSRLGAWASPQSQVIPAREWLEGKLAAVASQYQDNPPRPAHWGGYCVVPEKLEFWQGRSSRLHDRLHYRLVSDKRWLIERLAP